MSPPMPETQSEPNVIPLIDVLLALLIIFFAVIAIEKAKEAEKRKVIFAQSPLDSATSNSAGASIVLEVNPDGYRVNGTAVSADDLAGRLRAIYDARPDKVLFVKGDPAVIYQDVITAMDIARGAGVRVLGIPPKR